MSTSILAAFLLTVLKLARFPSLRRRQLHGLRLPMFLAKEVVMN